MDHPAGSLAAGPGDPEAIFSEESGVRSKGAAFVWERGFSDLELTLEKVSLLPPVAGRGTLLRVDRGPIGVRESVDSARPDA